MEFNHSLLRRLRFVVRRRKYGGSWGARRSLRRGVGLEFADYRDYAPGDDIRRIDWNLYARLERPYTRLHEEEQNLAVTLFIDGSASMGWRSEYNARWPAVQALAGALGAIALLEGDSLAAQLVCDAPDVESWGPFDGFDRLPSWYRWVSTLSSDRMGALSTPFQLSRRQSMRPGLALLLTDGYDLEGLKRSVPSLAGRGHEVALLHILTPTEINPDLHGDLRLVDIETQDAEPATLDATALAAYRQHFVTWQADLRRLANMNGGRYVLLNADAPVRRLILEDLRHAGILH